MTEGAPWAGILPSLPTPFTASGAADVDGFRAVVRFAVASGAHGLVCFGLAGEVSRLTIDERERLLGVAVEEAGDVPVLTGATAENLADALRLARHAEASGAAAIVVPPPVATRLRTPDLVQFIVEVAGATSVPAVVQDAPEYLGVGLAAPALQEIVRRAPTVRAVKLETGPEGIERCRDLLGDEIGVYGGNGGLHLLDGLRAGADGIMPGVDTVDLQVTIYELESAGRHRDAEQAFERLLPLLVYEMQTIEHYNCCAKHVLARRGLPVLPDLRKPAPSSLTPASIDRLDRHLARLGLAPLSATLAPTP